MNSRQLKFDFGPFNHGLICIARLAICLTGQFVWDRQQPPSLKTASILLPFLPVASLPWLQLLMLVWYSEQLCSWAASKENQLLLQAGGGGQNTKTSQKHQPQIVVATRNCTEAMAATKTSTSEEVLTPESAVRICQDVQHMIDINSEHLDRLRTPMATTSGTIIYKGLVKIIWTFLGFLQSWLSKRSALWRANWSSILVSSWPLELHWVDKKFATLAPFRSTHHSISGWKLWESQRTLQTSWRVGSTRWTLSKTRQIQSWIGCSYRYYLTLFWRWVFLWFLTNRLFIFRLD